jgi:hypothetical protein
MNMAVNIKAAKLLPTPPPFPPPPQTDTSLPCLHCGNGITAYFKYHIRRISNII